MKKYSKHSKSDLFLQDRVVHNYGQADPSFGTMLKARLEHYVKK